MSEESQNPSGEATSRLPKAVASGVLLPETARIDCHVLDDERRVLSQRTLVAAIGGRRGSGDLNTYLARIPNVPGHLLASATIEFVPQHGGNRAIGRESTFLIDMCQAYVDAMSAGGLKPAQVKFAIKSAIILGAFAKVGIEAAIDEATGYQKYREEDYLGRRLNAYLRDEIDRWKRRFPHSLVRALCPLYGVAWTGGRYPSELRKPFAEIYNLVLGPDVAGGLRERNPNPRHLSNHHQYLTEPVQQILADDLRVIQVLAEQSQSKEEFWARMRHHYRQEPLQLPFRRSA